MADEKSVERLVQKLRTMKNDLSPEEQESFAEMIRLAVRSAKEISEQEAKLAQGGDFKNYAVIMKPQSSHAILVGKGLDSLLEND